MSYLTAPIGRHIISYFPAPGRAFIGRVALFNGGFDYVVESIKGDEFQLLKSGIGYGPKLPCGSLPTLTKPDGSVITQSTAIARYAGKYGPQPLYDTKDPEQLIYVDEIVDTVEEMVSRLPNDPNPEKKKELRESYAKNDLPKYYSLFEKRIAKHGGPFVLGNKLSLADIAIYGSIAGLKSGNFDHIPKDFTDAYALCTKLYQAVSEHPMFIAFNQHKNLINPPKGLFKLQYFPGTGRGFAAKVALHNAGFEWEEEFITGKMLGEMKGSNRFSDDCPLGQLPILVTPDGTRIVQSGAIARFAGRYGKQSLYPNDPEQALLVDELIGTIGDIRPPMHADEEKKKQLREQWMKTDLVKFYNHIEKRLSLHGGPFLLGKQLSVADLALYANTYFIRTGNIDYVPKTYFNSFPLISELIENVRINPIVVSSKQLEDIHYPPQGKYKLTYFPVVGRGFAPKVSLFNAGIDFEDEMIAFPEFKERKPNLPLGSLPVLTKPDGSVVTQSVAIARYAGRYGKNPLYPNDPAKAYVVDEIMDICQDLSAKAPQDADPEKKKALREAWAQNELTKFLNVLNSRVLSNNAAGPFTLGQTLSLADLFIFTTVNMIKTGNLDYVSKDFADQYNELIKVYENVRNHPMIIASKQLDLAKA